MVTNLNQNRHLYVATGYDADAADLTTIGYLGAFAASEGAAGKEVTFLYKGADTMLKSDRIPVANITYAKAFKATATLLKSVQVALDSTINSGAPVVGQDYVLRINFRQFYGMGDQDQYFKDAAVHVTAAMDNAKKFFDAMKVALDKAFSREVGATADSNPYLAFSVSGSGSSAKLIITEKAQDWTLGIQTQERVYFDVFPTTIYTGGDDVIWGTVTDISATTNSTVGNGKKWADLEYFLAGERGDQYRMQGWPNYIPTTYLVDATKTYDAFEIHFAFTDTGVNSYRSEKDITIIVEHGANYTTINAIIGAFNSATGLSVATLS